ncbi:MAG: ATP-binding cassette domain-containing protein, partial [Aeriscardovia aeriphila]|nr:ATP-binding cassette domain-containing protein [Aeriscardovia aeriphila]
QRVERDRQAQVSETKRRNLARKELAWLTRGARARSTKQKFHVKAAEALIADVPPVRNSVELKAMATSRLGKDVVTLQDVTKTYPLASEQTGEITSTDNLKKPAEKTVIKDLTWIIGPGDRFGIVGANGAGKSTLLGLIDGSIAPTSGRVKIGKTVKFAVLSQRLDEVTKLGDAKVKEVLTRYKSTYVVDGKEYTPAKLLERLGFDAAQMMTPVCDLSGGQKRRMQLMLILLDEPNVLILDEPGNDLDTDMLAVMEDLLDDWPGTLIVVSHDRFLLERVTDHQFALINGTVRHLPGGVDDYLNVIEKRRKQVGLLAAEGVVPAADTALSLTSSDSARLVVNEKKGKPAAVGMPAGLTDSLVSLASDEQAEESKEEKRKKFDARKRQTAIMRKIDKLEADLADLDRKMAQASDAVGAASGDALQEALKKLADLTAQHESVGKEKAQLEDEWMQLGEFLEE